MPNFHLLIVEDEPDSAEVVELILEPAGVSSEVAGTAEDALAILDEAAGYFSGVIIDLALPGKDGFALLKDIRNSDEYGHLMTIAMTAYHTPELKSQSLAAGFDAYFPKPLDTALFLGTLERLLG